jgi:hypothetical protein
MVICSPTAVPFQENQNCVCWLSAIGKHCQEHKELPGEPKTCEKSGKTMLLCLSHRVLSKSLDTSHILNQDDLAIWVMTFGY